MNVDSWSVSLGCHYMHLARMFMHIGVLASVGFQHTYFSVTFVDINFATEWEDLMTRVLASERLVSGVLASERFMSRVLASECLMSRVLASELFQHI